MENIVLICMVFFGAAALYRWGRPILAALRRFDARNARRQEEQRMARFDPDAHYRETMRLADEQVEQIAEFTAPGPVKRYIFNGEEYDRLEEAEAARMAIVIEKARGFYVELDTIYLGRGGGSR
nr:MAG: hypothetical protein E4H34_00755 [Hyphomicrobiales bacterium]